MTGLSRYYSVLGSTTSSGIGMIKSSYRQLEKNVHPDTSTGIRDEPQRVMGDLNEAMRILAKAHARSFLEPKSLSPFRNFEDFKNADFNSKTQKIKKKLMI